jgi:hypothetical protein
MGVRSVRFWLPEQAQYLKIQGKKALKIKNKKLEKNG